MVLHQEYLKVKVVSLPIKYKSLNRATKSLTKCDRGGRYNSADTNWQYFLSLNKVLQYPGLPKENVMRNREVFVNIGNIKD